MLKNIKNLEGVAVLSKEQQKSINGGMKTSWCSRRSSNLIDLRTGVAVIQDTEGFLNSNGCWVYAGMPWNANPDCAPDDPMYTLLGAQGNAC